MKNLITKMVLLTFMMTLWSPNYATAAELALESASAVLMESGTGQVLYDQNAHEKRPPASVTKLMTLLIALEALDHGKSSLDDLVLTSAHASSLGGSQIYLEVGEQMSLQDMLIAIAVGSANDACVAVAEHLYGSEDAFVSAMNRKAQELGMTDTHFNNPYGLPDPEHYTSAYDLALLGQAALANEHLLQLTSIKHYTLRGDTQKPFELHNTNKLLWWYPGADGFKTGWVGKESGYCLASTASRKDLRLIAVVLGAPEHYGNFRDAMKLFNFGFANYQYTQFYQPKEIVANVPIEKGRTITVAIGAGTAVGLVMEKAHAPTLTTQYALTDTPTAPITQGTVLGELQILNGHEIIQRFPLVALETVEKCSFWQEFKRVCKSVYNS